MGMFDYVDAPAVQCECGAMVSDWQSKDGDCLLNTIPASDVNYYYSSCDNCKAWHTFHRIIPPETPFEHRVRRFP